MAVKTRRNDSWNKIKVVSRWCWLPCRLSWKNVLSLIPIRVSKQTKEKQTLTIKLYYAINLLKSRTKFDEKVKGFCHRLLTVIASRDSGMRTSNFTVNVPVSSRAQPSKNTKATNRLCATEFPIKCRLPLRNVVQKNFKA